MGSAQSDGNAERGEQNVGRWTLMVEVYKKAPTWASGLEGWPRSRLELGGEFGLEGGLGHHADDLLDDFAAFEQ